MGLKDAALFTGKLAAKTALFAGEIGIKVIQKTAETAINSGKATPPPNYDPNAGSGLAGYLSDLNKKIKL